MTDVKLSKGLRNACSIIAIISLTGCVGVHAAKIHARTVKPPHSAVGSDSTRHRTPAVPEPKPLMGELMA